MSSGFSRGAPFIYVVLLVSMNLAGQTDDACTLNPPVPVLRSDGVKKGTHQFKPKPVQEAIESATLRSGTRVVIEMGRCAHWEEIYRFEIPVPKVAACRDLLQSAAHLMAETAQASESPATLQGYAELLHEQHSRKEPYACGQALPVMPDEPGYGTLSVTTRIEKMQSLEVRVELNP
jgi:hypothetical protein